MLCSFTLTLALDGTGRSGSDLLRATLLLDSIVHFVKPSSVSTFLVITRPADLPVVRDALSPYLPRLPLRFVDEADLCPILAENPDTRNTWPRENVGWVRQQIIKLAVSQMISTPFYLTLDSDIVITHPVDIDTLIENGKSPVNIEHFADYQRLYHARTADHERDVRIERARNAKRVLGLQHGNLSGDGWFGETPVLLSRNIASGLIRHLSGHLGVDWEQGLIRNRPWTEYSLYYEYAVRSGLFDTYHTRVGANHFLNLSQSLWWPPDAYRDGRSLDTWDVARVFDAQSPGYAVAVQSYLGHDPASVRRRVMGYIPSCVTAPSL